MWIGDCINFQERSSIIVWKSQRNKSDKCRVFSCIRCKHSNRIPHAHDLSLLNWKWCPNQQSIVELCGAVLPWRLHQRKSFHCPNLRTQTDEAGFVPKAIFHMRWCSLKLPPLLSSFQFLHWGAYETALSSCDCSGNVFLFRREVDWFTIIAPMFAIEHKTK